MALSGEVAALLGAVVLSVGTAYNTLAGRKFGSMMMIRASVPMALVTIAILHWLTLGSPLPVAAGPERWFWLGASGLAGLVGSFVTMVEAFMRIGARLTALMLALAPVFSAVLAWLFLEEALDGLTIAGMALTIAGIMWVVADGNHEPQEVSSHDYRIGLLFALVAAVTQSISLVLGKQGLVGDYPALSGNLIRFIAGVAALWGYTVLRGQVRPTWQLIKRERASLHLVYLGALFAAVLGAWLRLIAVQGAPVGVANTILSLRPIFLLPIGVLVFHETITRRAILGTVVAFGGTALLFL